MSTVTPLPVPVLPSLTAPLMRSSSPGPTVMTALPLKARVYICVVVLAGLVAGGFALPHVRQPW